MSDEPREPDDLPALDGTWTFHEIAPDGSIPTLPPGPGIFFTGPGRYIRIPALSERARGLLPGRDKCRHKKPKS
jgi:hypothetical protein